MKNNFKNIKNAIAISAIALSAVICINNSIAVVGENANMVKDIEFMERVRESAEGFEIVEYMEKSEDAITYIAEDENGNQFLITYSEDEQGNPISTIRVWKP